MRSGRSERQLYTIVDNPTTGFSSRAAMAYAVIRQSGSCSISANFSDAAQNDIIVHELSGVNTGTPLDGHKITYQNLVGPGTDAISSGSITTHTAGAYIFGETVLDDFNYAYTTVGTGFSEREVPLNGNAMSEDRILPSPGPVAATFTAGYNNSYITGIMAFQPAVGTQVSSRSDALSDSRPSATSNHTLVFTPHTQVTGSSTITLAYPTGFAVNGFDCGDIDAATSSQFNFNYPACAPTATAWGAVMTGGNNNYVQGNAEANSGAIGQATVPFLNNVAAGDLVVVAAFWNGAVTALSVTDTLANVYTAVEPQKVGAGALATWRTQVFYSKNVKGGADSVTIKLSGAATNEIALYIHEYAGADPYAPLDVTSVATGNAGTPDSGSKTTNAANELIVGFTLMSGSSYGEGNGFARRSGLNNNLTEDKIVRSIGSYSAFTQPDLAGSQDWVMWMATFKITPIGTGIILSAPTDSTSTVHVATGTPITIKIGTNATQQQTGVHQITNPSTPGTYTISVGGTFGGVGNIPVSINAGFEVAAQVAESLSLTVSGGGASSSFPTTGILDNFNRDPENPLYNGHWSGPVNSINGVLQLSGNAATITSWMSDSYWSSSAFGPNSEAYATVSIKPDNYCMAVICKIANPNSSSFNAYWGEYCTQSGTDSWTIYKFSNNSPSELSMSGSYVELNAGDSIGLECTPGSQKLKRKSGGVWTDVMTSTDTSYDNISGYIGLHVEDIGEADDFGGGTVVPACAADDGATVNAVATTGTSVPFGLVSPNTFYQGCQDLNVSTNAPGGYSLSVQESYAMRTASGGYTIPDTTCNAGGCTQITAASWTDPTKNGYGHTCWNVSGNDCAGVYANGTKFRPFASMASGASFPTTGILDNFNRDDGDLGVGNWTCPLEGGHGGMDISNFAIVTHGGANLADCYWDDSTLGPDSEAYVKITTKPLNGQCVAVSARLSGVGGSISGYWAEYCANAGADRFDLYRFDSGTPTNIANGTQELSSGDSIGLEVIGSAIRMYYKIGAGAWTQKLSVTDGTYQAAGNVGVHAESSTVVLDDFGGGTVGNGQVIMASSTPAIATGRIKHRLSVPSSLPAGTYSTIIRYILTPTY